MPSGLDSDSGIALGEAVRADRTVLSSALKTGLFLGEGPELRRPVFFDDLEVPAPATPHSAAAGAHHRDRDRAALPRRARAANKGDFGRVLIVGGGVGMPGAARLSGEACLRVGAGLVTVAVGAGKCGRHRRRPAGTDLRGRSRSQRSADGTASAPMWWRSARDSAARAGRATPSSRSLGCGKPLVVDADALNIF